VFVLFEHHHARTLAQHKTVAVFVPGAGSGFGVVVACGKCTHGGKATHAQGRHGGLGAARHSHIGIAVFNHATCLPNAVQPGGARSHHREVGPLEAKPHRNMPSHHVDDGSGHEKRSDAPRTPCGQLGVGVLDQRQAADTRTDHAGNARCQFVVQGLARGQACILHSLGRRSDAEMDEGVHRARILGADVGLQIESLDLACNPAGKVRRVELGDEINAGLTGQPGLAQESATVLPTGLTQPRPVTTTRRRLMRKNLLLIAQDRRWTPAQAFWWVLA
jgi:hypothetical protein